jgi:crotonobetainyl-CoA:carnitine CoA-transferase CaiB-like acyl-CoA transferase
MLFKMRLVSFCHYLQGPAATQYLADMGADVVKVEPPGGAYERRWSGGVERVGGVSTFFLCANRNARSIAIDLKHKDGRELALRLCAEADVVMENFRPGVMDKLGIGYEAIKARKPDIIYASASGFGTEGPLRDNPGQDLLIQARAGLIAATGDIDHKPTPIGNAAVDQHGAALLAMGVLGAYVKRLQTGKGTRVDASLLGAGIDIQTEPLTMYYSGRGKREMFRRDPHLATWYHEAPYGVYRMADGWVTFSMSQPAKLGEALESEAISAYQGKDTYVLRDEYAKLLAGECANRRLADHKDALDRLGVWYAPVQDYDTLRDDPQVRFNKSFIDVPVNGETATLVNHPIRYDGESATVRVLATELGQHTREIMEGLGYEPATIDQLAADGVVVAAQGESAR